MKTCTGESCTVDLIARCLKQAALHHWPVQCGSTSSGPNRGAECQTVSECLDLSDHCQWPLSLRKVQISHKYYVASYQVLLWPPPLLSEVQLTYMVLRPPPPDHSTEVLGLPPPSLGIHLVDIKDAH